MEIRAAALIAGNIILNMVISFFDLNTYPTCYVNIALPICFAYFTRSLRGLVQIFLYF